MTKFNDAQMKHLEKIIVFKADDPKKGFYVLGSILGDVLGSILGDVEGSVRGHVWGSVKGSVWGDVEGHVDGSVKGSVEGKSIEELEDKLAKALKALDAIRLYSTDGDAHRQARTTIAELSSVSCANTTGDKDE